MCPPYLLVAYDIVLYQSGGAGVDLSGSTLQMAHIAIRAERLTLPLPLGMRSVKNIPPR